MKKKKLAENTLFFYNGKEYEKFQPNHAKLKNKMKNNNNSVKIKIISRKNPITKNKIDFSDDEIFSNPSDIDDYLNV